jgi:hypothetical protein
VSKSQIVARHLPFLRRYARALTGSQSSGDAYVTAVLEALLEDPDNLPESEDPRVGLYRTFTKIWNSVPVNGSASADERTDLPGLEGRERAERVARAGVAHHGGEHDESDDLPHDGPP